LSNRPIYLDNAATTYPKPESVYTAMDEFYRQHGGNAGRGANPLARRSAALLDETRLLVAHWLDAPDVVFAASATMALNTVILGADLRAGDIVYTTPFEHNSVLRPLEYLRQSRGIDLRVLPFDKLTFACDVAAIEQHFQLDKPALVCLTQVSNVTGYMPPVDQIIRRARAVNPTVITLVDGAQGAGLISVDMSLVDALVFSGHKSLYGPYGIAGIAFGSDWRPQPLLYGGTGTVSESVEMPAIGPSRFEAGSHNISAFAGLNAAVKWLNKTGRDAIHTRIADLTSCLIDALPTVPGVQLYLPADISQHHGVVSFTMGGVGPQGLETVLGAQNIAVRAGLHCAPWTHKFMGTLARGGTVRVSPGYFNSAQDFVPLMACVQSVVGGSVGFGE